MKFLYISPDKSYTNQTLQLVLPMNDVSVRVNIDLVYKEKTDRWYMSMYSAQSGEAFFTLIPLVSSQIDNPISLWAPFFYKNIGLLFCTPKVDHPSTENPSKGNIDEFYIVWSDGVA